VNLRCFDFCSESVTPVSAAPLPSSSLQTNSSQLNTHEVADRHSRAVTTLIVIFTVLIVVCALVVAFHRPERRRSFVMSVKRLCGFGPAGAKYRYISVSTWRLHSCCSGIVFVVALSSVHRFVLVFSC